LLPVQWHDRRLGEWLALGVAGAAALSLLVLREASGQDVPGLDVLPVLVAGLFLGMRAGLVTAGLVFIVMVLLRQAAGVGGPSLMSEEGLPSLLVLLVIGGAFGVVRDFGMQLRGALTDRDRAEEELRRTSDLLKDEEGRRRYLLHRLAWAAEDERTRIAADIHDGPIQQLVALNLRLDSLVRRLAGRGSDQALLLEAIGEGLRAEIRDLRRLTIQLRPPALLERGLEAALREHAEGIRRQSGLRCSIEWDVDKPIPAALETVLYRVAQEGIRNVVKHAKTARARLAVHREGTSIVLVLEDYGVGFEAAHPRGPGEEGGYGLESMRSRVVMAGGHVQVRSRPGEGTHLRLSLPIREAPQDSLTITYVEPRAAMATDRSAKDRA
jgi:signal transduction histidine kinase